MERGHLRKFPTTFILLPIIYLGYYNYNHGYYYKKHYGYYYILKTKCFPVMWNTYTLMVQFVKVS